MGIVTQTDADAARLLVIELAGPPGAGKTSLLPTVQRVCEAAGLRPYTVEHAARAFAARTPLGRLAARLPKQLRRRALWSVFYLGSAVGAARLAIRRPNLARYVARTQRNRPPDSDVAERRVVYWYVRTVGAWEFLRRWGRPGEALIVDEGFAHRVVQLHTSSVERPDVGQISRYVGLLPPIDLLVVVHAPMHSCQRRVRSRGVWPRLQHRGTDEIDRFVANAHLAIGFVADELRHRGQPMVEVDNTGDLAHAEVELEKGLERGLCPAVSVDRWRAPRLRIPRLARLVAHVSARRDPPAVASVECATILERYGLALLGHPANVPFGRRNHNVVVTTSAGLHVLRRYRDAAWHTSVRHEHAVLTELERRGFPAVRLHRTLDGETLVEHAGHLYALFEFEDGSNLSSYILPGRGARRRLQMTAGRTLARLHHELAEFAPDTAHHLGYLPDSGDRTQDLDWHLAALAALPTQRPAVGPRGQHHQATLAARASELADRLRALHDTVEHASLPRVMIHGDYGVHNLLIRGGGVAVVSDFELARRDWRLVDLVIVLSRIRPRRAQAFMYGYRSAATVTSEEWRLLPEVWQYYRLTGAVRSWHNHFVHGGDQRLAAAYDRVLEADWARREVSRLWA